MTIFGKILVFVNLAFSLVVGGLVMMVYLTRANWEDAYRKSEAQLKAVGADRDQFQRDMETAKKDFDTRLATANKDRDDAIKIRDNAKQELGQKEAELTAIKQKE